MTVALAAALVFSTLVAAEPADAGTLAVDSGAPAAEATAAVSADAGAAEPAKARRTLKGEKRASAALLRYLRRQTVGEWCAAGNWGAPATLDATKFLELRDGSLLIFVQVPDYLCNATNKAVPVVVSAKGDWKWGAPLEGLVTHLAKSEDGTLWATSQWQIEGTYPKLWRSRDGIAWKEVELPKERPTTGPMEELKTLCFGYRTVVVKIENGDTDAPATEVWSRERVAGAAEWSKETKGVDGGCLPPQAAVEKWRRDADEDDRVLFLKDKQVFSLPKLLRPR